MIENDADINTRNHFGIHEPIHKWEAYYLGDASVEAVNSVAKSKGYEDYTELFDAMDEYFMSEYESLLGEKISSFSEYLCKCNNCGSIMFDENPNIEQDRIPLSLVEVPIGSMGKFEDEQVWGCYKCKTDAFLMDVELSDFQ